MARGTRAQRLEDETMELLRMIYVLLMPGVADLLGFNTLSQSKLYTLISRAEDAGLIKTVKVGQTFELQNRVILTHKGIIRVCAHFSLPLKEQLCADSVAENLNRLRLYEPTIRLLPRLFSSGAVRTPLYFQRDPGDDPHMDIIEQHARLEDIDWLESAQENSVHAIAWYRTALGHLVWVPVITTGFHHISHAQAERDALLSREARINPTVGLDVVPAFLHGLRPATPLGIVHVVIDPLAGLFVQRHYPGPMSLAALPAAIVDASGIILRQMTPRMPLGRIERPPACTKRIGLPEEELEKLLGTQKVQAMMGVTQRKIFEWVNGIQGCTVKQIADGVGHGNGDVKQIIDEFTDAELMIKFDDCIYLGDAGRVAAAFRDRMHPNAVHGRFRLLTSKDPSERLRNRAHEQAVALVKDRLKRGGIMAFEGWRLEITYPGKGGTQVRPDLWALVPLGDGTAMWCAVEVERSAANKAAIARKLGPLRVARECGEEWPVLVVAGKGVRSEKGWNHDLAAARLFASQGDDLPLLAIPFYQAMQGRMTGPDQGWLRDGERVPVTHLRAISKRRDLIVSLERRAWQGKRIEGITNAAFHPNEAVGRGK